MIFNKRMETPIFKIIVTVSLLLTSLYSFGINDILNNEVDSIQKTLPTKITRSLTLSRVYTLNNTLYFKVNTLNSKA